jgi:hypothetical protein
VAHDGDGAMWSGDTGSLGGMSLPGGGEGDALSLGDGNGDVEEDGGADGGVTWAGDDAR